MSQNSRKGKSPAPSESENNISTPSFPSPIPSGDASSAFAAKVASSAASLARDVFSASSLTSSNVSGAIASFTNGKTVAGASSSSHAANPDAGAAQVARYAGNTAATMAEQSQLQFRTLGPENSNIEADFDAFFANDGHNDGVSNLEHTDMSTEQVRAEMQELHESWHREWARHPGDIEGGSGVGSSATSVVGVGEDIAAVEKRDGGDVVALLHQEDDNMTMTQQPRTFYPEEDLLVELADAKDVDASDLFPGMLSSLSSQSQSHPQARDPNTTINQNALGAPPDILHNPKYNFLPFSASPAQNAQDQEIWLRDWERVLTSYADDVWDPSSFPWVLEARETMREVNDSGAGVDTRGIEARERALERLRVVVGHIMVPDAGVGAKVGRGKGESAGGG